MKRSLPLLAVFLGFLHGLFHEAEARRGIPVTDATGARVTLAAEPVRIVALAPALGELAADLLGNDLQRIVGVSEFTDYPPALKGVDSIGPYFRFNLEKVVALRPDLVLATTDGNPKDQVQHLRELGLPVVVIDTGSFAQVESSMRLVGRAIGKGTEGEAMAAQFERGLAHFAERAAGRSHPRITLQLGEAPLIVVGKGSFLSEALERIGAVNAYSDTGNTHYPKPSVEDVIRRDPDDILVLSLGSPGQDLAPFRKMVEGWARFPSLRAVRNHHVSLIESEALLRPTLRLLEGLSLLEKRIYGGS